MDFKTVTKFDDLSDIKFYSEKIQRRARGQELQQKHGLIKNF